MKRRRDVVSFVVMLACAAGVAVVRPRAAARFHELRVKADVYPFGSPEQTIVASLGFRSALADAIYAHVLVSYGLHFQEKRRFEFVGDYLDTINALDPEFGQPYRMADTLLVIAPEAPKLEHYQKAREILLRGTKQRPYDAALWSTTGQFLAYIAPGNLPEDMRAAWRLEGAKVLARACELASNNGNIPYHCITAARLLNDAGQREAGIQSLERLIAVTDDPEVRRLALGYLGKLRMDREKEQKDIRGERLREKRQQDLPFMTTNGFLALAPLPDVARCAGRTRPEDVACATSWLDWGRLSEPVVAE